MHSKYALLFHSILLASCVLAAACSTVRLTPSAAHYRKDGGSQKAQAQAELVRADLEAVRLRASRVESALLQDPELAAHVAQRMGGDGKAEALRSDPIGFLESTAREQQGASDAEGRALLVNRIIDLWWTGLLDPKYDERFARIVGKPRPVAAPGAGTPAEPPPLLESQAKIDYLEKQLGDLDLTVRQLQAVEGGDFEYFVDGSVYFSIEPMVAVRPGLEAVAIPSLAVNWRPFNMDTRFLWWGGPLGGLSSMALQATFGGALNPSGSGDDSTTGALGVGLSFPIASFGAFSFGSVWFDQDGDSKGAPYISITLGDFGKSTTPGGS